MNIMLTNDDGYDAVGLWAIHDALVDFGHHVTVVAPLRQQSWKGKSMTHDSPLILDKTKHNGVTVYTVDGSPAQCVQLGLHEVMDTFPHFVVSGINHGGNDSTVFALASGTLGAAMEASFEEVPAVGVSLAGIYEAKVDGGGIDEPKSFKVAAELAVKVIDRLKDHEFPKHTDFISMNVPAELKSSEVKVAPLNRSPYGYLYNRDAMNEKQFNLSLPVHDLYKAEPIDGTDTYYLRKGFPTLTPFSLEMTTSEGRAHLEKIINS